MFKVETKAVEPLLGSLVTRGALWGRSECSMRARCADDSIGHLGRGPSQRQGARGRTVTALLGFATVAPTMLVSGMFQSNGPQQDRSIGKALVVHLRQHQSASGQCLASRECAIGGMAGVKSVLSHMGVVACWRRVLVMRPLRRPAQDRGQRIQPSKQEKITI